MLLDETRDSQNGKRLIFQSISVRKIFYSETIHLERFLIWKVIYLHERSLLWQVLFPIGCYPEQYAILLHHHAEKFLT